MDPDDLFFFRIFFDIFYAAFAGAWRSVFVSLLLLLIWVTVGGAIFLLRPQPLTQAVLVGFGFCGTLVVLFVSAKLLPRRQI